MIINIETMVTRETHTKGIIGIIEIIKVISSQQKETLTERPDQINIIDKREILDQIMNQIKTNLLKMIKEAISNERVITMKSVLSLESNKKRNFVIMKEEERQEHED